MKVYGDLTISTTLDQVRDFVQALQSTDAPGWSRNMELEEQLERSFTSQFCFNFAAEAAHPNLDSANLWLAQRHGGSTLYVSNILPTKKSALNQDQYNAILHRFDIDLVTPVAQQMGVGIAKSKTDPELEDLVDADAAQVLRAFSALANKSTGSSHPMDKARWNTFLIIHHRSGSNLPVDLLETWLQEDGWDADSATELAIQFEQGRDLLRQFDGRG